MNVFVYLTNAKFQAPPLALQDVNVFSLHINMYTNDRISLYPVNLFLCWCVTTILSLDTLKKYNKIIAVHVSIKRPCYLKYIGSLYYNEPDGRDECF